MQNLILLLVLLFLNSCKEKKTAGNENQIEFSQPVNVTVTGYSGNLMEPFISRDGSILLFNNLNSAPENTNLHWATRINDSSFEYKGEVAGVNTADLEGVPTLDNAGNLYFVSTRNYSTTLSTLYQSKFSNGSATNVQLINGISKLQAGWVNFDIEVSADGNTLYFVDSRFEPNGIPATAELVIAEKNASGFKRMATSNEIMKNINTTALEYAAAISTDQLEFYFTRVPVPITASSNPEIFVATRKSTNEPFGQPSKIQSLTGFVEAATIAPDQRTIYFHKKENDKFGLYMIRKK